MRFQVLSRSHLFIVLVLALLSSGCSNPMNYEVKKLTEEQKAEIGQKLTADEGRKLAQWQVRNAIGSKEIPDGFTVAQAVKDQEAWEAQRKEEEAKAEELAKRVEAERKAKQEEFAKLLSVAVVAKRNHVGEYQRRMVLLDVAFENKSSKDIAGVKSVLNIADMFGDKIINITWSFDGGVAAGQTFVERGSGLEVNQFMDNHMKLWNSELEKLKIQIDTQTIIFKDGTTIEAPQ